MPSKKNLKVIISGGGTGGHIYPAVAIANQLKAENPATEILFVGALGRMEMTRVPEAGYQIIGLNIAGLQRKLTLSNLSFPFKVYQSIRQAHKILKDFKPDAVVGVGGYASGPMLYAAASHQIPTLIQEQNSYAGITNKILSKKVDKICVAYDSMYKFFPANKLVLTGNPVRNDIVDCKSKKDEAFNHFGLTHHKKTILVIGGSLGARTLNESTARNLKAVSGNGYQLIWQTGKSYFAQAQDEVANAEEAGLKAFDFIKRMDLAYAAADVVISRAGALSISELCLTGKPAILVPSPNVAEDHQTKNAMALVEKDAAILVRDADAPTTLYPEAFKLMKDDTRQQQLSANITKLGRPQAATDIVNELLKLIK